MKIICVIAIYKRSQITLRTLELMKKQTYPFYKIIAVGSCDIDRETAAKAGVEYVQYQNQPLSNKWQHGVEYARKFNPDAILINGSDSWLSTNWCELAKQYIEEGFHLIGKTEWYTCKVNPGEKLFIIHRAYKSRKDPVGAGRLISKSILDRLNWKLYPTGLRTGLDGESCRNILRYTTGDKIKLMNDIDRAIILDIKSTSWHTINPFTHLLHNSQFTGSGEVKDVETWLNKYFPNALETFKMVVPSLIV